jgi:lysophospholipase L1-like esterase
MSNVKQLKDAQGNSFSPKTSIDALTSTGGGGKFLVTNELGVEESTFFVTNVPQITGTTEAGHFASFDANGGLQDSGCNEGTFIKGVQQNGVDLLKDEYGKVNVTVQDGEDGLSAFEIAQQQGYTGTVDQWLASLKANIGEFLFVSTDAAAVTAMATIGQTYSSAIDPQGKNVAPTQNTLSVILLMNDDATTPSKTMMIVTQESATPGTYEFIYAGDLQSAMSNNVLTEDDIVDNLTTNDATKALSANQGRLLNDKVQKLVELTHVSSNNGYRLLVDGTYYYNGMSWDRHKYNIDPTIEYYADFGVIGGFYNNVRYCGIQYFNSSDVFLGYEVASVGTTTASNRYYEKYRLTIPENTAYLYLQSTENYNGNFLGALYKSFEVFDAVDEANENITELQTSVDTINDTITYFEPIPFTIKRGGHIIYNTGELAGSNYHTDYVNVEGLIKVRYSRLVSTSTTTVAGMAFYTANDGTGYISGKRCILGAEASSYKLTDIDVPPTAKYARFTIWSDNTDGFELYNGEGEPLNQDNIEKIVDTKIDEALDNIDLGVKVLEGKKISIIGDSISCFGSKTQTQSSGYNAPYWIIKTIDVGQQIQSWITWLDVYETVDGTTPRNQTIGGTPLTAAMIGTLQTFTPTSEDVGKCLGVARWASNYTTKPWWQVLIEKSGAELCNNASWSGSRICEIPVGNSRHDAFVLSEAYSDYTLSRVCKRDDEGNTIVPDVIIIYRGTNDFSGIDPEGGTGTADTESLTTPNMITWDESNFDTHNFTEGYIHTILELRRRYKDAYIILCTLNVVKRVHYSKFPTDNGTYTLPEYSDKIREIANLMGCGLIELDKDGITFENCYSQGYITDSETTPTHPNTKGHRVMGEKAFTDVLYCLNPT